MKLPFNTKDNYQVRKLKFLKDMVQYYSEDVTRRSMKNGSCQYWFEENKCAIGRYLSFYKKDMEGKSVVKVLKLFPDCIPESVKKLGIVFLDYVQVLHDNNTYWTNNGLSEQGRAQYALLVKRIKEKIL